MNAAYTYPLDLDTLNTAIASGVAAKAHRPLRAACIGTSIYANGLNTLDNVTVQVGNSWSAANMGRYSQAPGGQSWFTWACLLSGGRLLHLYNGAESSSTSDSWVTRFQSDVLSRNPDIVFFGDITNDLNTTWTDAQIRSNITSLASQCVKAGVTPCLVGTIMNTTAAKNQRISLHNQWLQRYAWQNGFPYIDPFPAIIDTTSTIGANQASLTSDGLHPNEAGAKLIGQRAVDQLAGILHGTTTPSSVPFIVQHRAVTPNLLQNPLFQDDANADGLADSWAKAGSPAVALATDSRVLGKMQQVTVSANSQGIQQDVAVNGTNASAGDRLAFSGLIEVSAASGSLQWNVGLFCLGQTGVWTATVIGSNSGGPVATDLSLAPFYIEIPVPTGATLVRARAMGFTGTGTISVAQWRVLNLTKNGLDGLY